MKMSDVPEDSFLDVVEDPSEDFLKQGNAHDSNAEHHWNSRAKLRFKYCWNCSYFQLILLFTNLFLLYLNSGIASMSPSIKASQITKSTQQAYLCEFISSW